MPFVALRPPRVAAVALAVLGWAGVVATVSAVSWTAIDSAGRQVAGMLDAAPVDGSSMVQQTDGGRVALECRADGGHLRWASPAEGWRVERKDVRMGGRVRVDFLTAHREIVVRGWCTAAGPMFTLAEELPPEDRRAGEGDIEDEDYDLDEPDGDEPDGDEPDGDEPDGDQPDGGRSSRPAG